MIFVLLAACMGAVAVACVAIPLWRNSRPAGSNARTVAAEEIYRRQLAELDRDLADGSLAKSDYASALRDLEQERRTSNSLDTAAPGQNLHGQRYLAIGLATVMVCVAGLMYWKLGNWRTGVEGVQTASSVSIRDMVARLSARLHSTDKDDLKGWKMLGQAYMVMDQYQDATAAFKEARRLTDDKDPDVLAAYAEASTLADPDRFMQDGAPLFEQVLKMDPDNLRALWYGGLAASQEGNNALAVKRWQRLLKQDLPQQYRTYVSNYIVQAGGTVTASETASSAGSVVHVHVSLSPVLSKILSPDETVFVFARPANESGGPPLAVHRLQVRDLPLNVTLSDKDAMIKGRNLSSVDTVELVARVSKDGSPLPKPGDPVGSAIWKREAGHTSVNIVISTPGS